MKGPQRKASAAGVSYSSSVSLELADLMWGLYYLGWILNAILLSLSLKFAND